MSKHDELIQALRKETATDPRFGNLRMHAAAELEAMQSESARAKEFHAAELADVTDKRDALQARLVALEKQEPVGHVRQYAIEYLSKPGQTVINRNPQCVDDVPLYLASGAAPASTAVPEGWGDVTNLARNTIDGSKPSDKGIIKLARAIMEWDALRAAAPQPPASAVVPEEITCEDCGDVIVPSNPGVCGTCFAIKYKPPASEPRPVNCGTGHCSCIECVVAPASEPEYWQWRKKDDRWGIDQIFRSQVFATTDDSEIRGLYASPPAREPTDDEIQAIADGLGDRYSSPDDEGMTFEKHAVIDFARAVLAAR